MTGPDPALVDAYWDEVSRELGLHGADVPEAWAFGGTAEQADELLRLVLSGVKTATSSALWCYEEGEALPEVGEVSIVCDGRGRPRALLRVTQVSVTAFDEVSEDHARAEGEGDRSLAHWRRVHAAFFAGVLPVGREVTESMPVVVERFERLAP